MLGWMFVHELNRERAARRRRHELDEQAERQRLRAPEPGLEPAPRTHTSSWLAVLLMLPVVIGAYMLGERIGFIWFWVVVFVAGFTYGWVRAG
jgi:hypothetical protein